MTSTTPQPGDRRPRLDRAPSERYPALAPPPAADPPAGAFVPLAIVLGGAVAFVLLGGVLAVTAGLVILAAVVGWLIGTFVSPPLRAGLVGLGAVAVGLLGIWLFGRLEGGVMDPVAYFLQVHGGPLVALEFLAGGGLAAAAAR
ncbi:MAG TPA: hypothetical protein VM427_05045 [Patescibacteria group bacterium]|nr:hypothetical protein [Patescibacteria group bacterium]